MDFIPDRGKAIKAARSGAVIYAATKGDYGKTVIIYHNEKFTTWYCHLNQIYVNVGDLVKTGEIIAEMGSSGRSTDTHLHFEMRIGKIPVDPMLYIPAQK